MGVDRAGHEAERPGALAPVGREPGRARTRGTGPAAALVVGAVDDPAERDADRFADQALRALAGSATGAASAGVPAEGGRVRRALDDGTGAAVGAEGGDAPHDVSARIRAAAGRGEPMEPRLRSRFELATGADLGAVRIHSDSEDAPRIAARAFTLGSDIHFAPGEYDPATTAGQRVLAHEVGHVLQQGAGATRAARTIRRTPLDADAILAKVDALDPQLKARLDEVLPGEKDAKSAVTMRAHVKRAIEHYLSRSTGTDVRDNAVTLSIALDGIAGVVSDALYDPWIRPKLATRLLDLYKADLNEQLGGKAAAKDEAETAQQIDARRTTALAGVLLTNDPVGLYMHGELPIEEAARRIVLMSKNATAALNDYAPPPADGAKSAPKVTADEMFTLLRRRFESQMLAYSKSAVARREDTRGTYSTRESTDRLSARYFSSLFSVDDPKAVTDFTTQASKRLDDLGAALATAVDTWRPLDAVKRRSGVDTDNEERVLQAIERRDAGITTSGLVADLVQFCKDVLGFDDTKAAAAVTALRNKLDAAPLTISMPGSVLFERGVPKGDDALYQPATVQQNVSTETEQFGRGDEPILHVGAYDNPIFVDDRSDRYLQFRIWKDRLMSGNLGLAPEEMPKYGALNYAFDVNYGSTSTMRPDDKQQELRDQRFADLSLKDKKRRIGQNKMVGESYYGDVHLVLKRSVRDDKRVVFTATDHGAPHHDPLMAVHDALTGASFITNLKQGAQLDIVLGVFNSAATAPLNHITNSLKLEAQIYGTVDMRKHVETIAVAPYSHKDVKKHAKAFCKKYKIQYVEIAADDPKLSKDTVTRALQPADIAKLSF